jgi:outer membrane protein, multidrug efflux system
MRPTLPVLVCALSFSTLALAQGPASPAQAAPPGESPAGAATSPVALPPPPTIDDPMLAPMPAAPRNVSTWEEALDLIRARSTDLRTAYDEVLRAAGLTRSALAATLPTVTLTGTYAYQNGNYSTAGAICVPPTCVLPAANSLAGQAMVTQPIIALEAWHSIKTSRENERAVELSFDDMKRTIALNVADAIIGVVTAERVAELNRVGTRNALERLDIAQKKRTLGAASTLDVVRAQQDVESARATLVTGDESLRQAREALGLALGLPQQVGVTKDLKMDGLVQSAIDSCKVAPSVEQRADVAAARTRLLVAKRNVDDVYYQFLPTVTASSTASYSNLYAGIPGDATATWNILGVLTVPLWDGGLRYGSLRQMRALEDEALQSLESLRRQAIIQVEQARRDVGVAEDSRRVAASARALAAETDRLTRVGYIEGQGTSLELVIAAAALREADITLALREFDLVKARVLAILALANCPW